MIEKFLFLWVSLLLLINKESASQFCREPANENKQFQVTKRMISNSQFIRQSFQGYRCKLDIVIFAWRVTWIMLTVPNRYILFSGQRSSSLHYAACFGRPGIGKVLLRHGANPDLRLVIFFLRHGANPDLRLVIIFLRHGANPDLRLVIIFLLHGANPDIRFVMIFLLQGAIHGLRLVMILFWHWVNPDLRLVTIFLRHGASKV